jgi:hypothetical protein
MSLVLGQYIAPIGWSNLVTVTGFTACANASTEIICITSNGEVADTASAAAPLIPGAPLHNRDATVVLSPHIWLKGPASYYIRLL